jgi:hypothetical protein
MQQAASLCRISRRSGRPPPCRLDPCGHLVSRGGVRGVADAAPPAGRAPCRASAYAAVTLALAPVWPAVSPPPAPAPPPQEFLLHLKAPTIQWRVAGPMNGGGGRTRIEDLIELRVHLRIVPFFRILGICVLKETKN